MSDITNDEKWNAALESSDIVASYEGFYNKLKTKASTWKAGSKLVKAEDYEVIMNVAKAEKKLYSAYVGREVTDYTDDLSESEQKDIENRLKTTFNANNKTAYAAVNYTKSIVTGKNKDHDKLFDLYKDNIPANELAVHEEIKIKSEAGYVDEEPENQPHAPENDESKTNKDFGINAGVLAAGIGLSAVAKYTSKSAQSDALQNGAGTSHASKEEARRSNRKRNMKLAFSVVLSTLGAFVAIDGLMLKGKYTKSVLNSMSSKSDPIQR